MVLILLIQPIGHLVIVEGERQNFHVIISSVKRKATDQSGLVQLTSSLRKGSYGLLFLSTLSHDF